MWQREEPVYLWNGWVVDLAGWLIVEGLRPATIYLIHLNVTLNQIPQILLCIWFNDEWSPVWFCTQQAFYFLGRTRFRKVWSPSGLKTIWHIAIGSMVQIAKTIGLTSIRYRSDIFASHRYLVDIDPEAFVIWNISQEVLPTDLSNVRCRVVAFAFIAFARTCGQNETCKFISP